ncbi:MAG: selenoneine biosynthesis selenosugar synthase SenB [Acidobacteriota bacterium]
MRIKLVTPSPQDVLDGNRVTVRRWARILKGIGHRPRVEGQYQGGACDLLIAVHARKSFSSIRRFRREQPESPLVVVLSGTDLYRDLRRGPEVQESLEMATHVVVLQKQALEEIPQEFRWKATVIYQSADPVKGTPEPPKSYFRVCTVGNLRAVKDPFRLALAGRRLPTSSRVRIWQVGRALSVEMKRKAEAEERNNGRYRWISGLPYWRTRRLIASSHLVSITSKVEGSSNVLSEALISSVPVVASRIPGLIGTLGEGYSGFFPPGDTQALKQLLLRTETEPGFYRKLKNECARLASVVQPHREQKAWERLLKKIQKTRG